MHKHIIQLQQKTSYLSYWDYLDQLDVAGV